MSSNIFFYCSLVTFFVLVLWILFQKNDSTTSAEINVATKVLKEKIAKAEMLVGACNPHSAACREQLNRARRCLSYDKSSTRIVVSAGMILEKRNQGIAIAQELIESMNSSRAIHER